MPVHQVLALQAGVVGQAELPQRQFEMRLLGFVRVQADRHQDEVGEVRGALAEIQDAVVPGVVGLEPEVRLQCRVFPADAVEPGDLGDDVARRLVVARTQLVFLRVEVLLLARQGRRLAQLEAGVHAPQPRPHGRQGGTDEEAGAAGALQEPGIDVRGVDEEVRPVAVAPGWLVEFGEVLRQFLLCRCAR